MKLREIFSTLLDSSERIIQFQLHYILHTLCGYAKCHVALNDEPAKNEVFSVPVIKKEIISKYSIDFLTFILRKLQLH